MDLPAHHYLDQLNIPYRRLAFPPTTEKGAANVAHALGFTERQMVKTLIFQVADTAEQVLIMVGGDQSARSGLLKKAIGSRNIQMSKPESVLNLTDYVVGSIPPFHWQPPNFRSFLEASLMHESELGVGAGQWGEEIIITPANLVIAARALVVPLVEEA
ncbi:MAG: YbaK/EbsC family protein [Anaerolineae bacterium]|nr:YbaK/EbsC family protein [Anaerolineae bacterium]